ncbi:MAG: hypothetical protein C5B52_04800 [Bacteroidetes bacterium]|nr:MAG: hypothetical protein C5B52_04800 [Bacteroidota bacterium]
MLGVATVLSWINIVVGGIFLFVQLLGSVMIPDGSAMIVPILLSGAIILHSYASMQLRKSIVNPNIPLSSQTPIGIRFIGFLAMIAGIIFISSSVWSLQNTAEIVKQAKLPDMAQLPKGFKIENFFKFFAVVFILISVSIILNVLLNFSLLRWYLFSKKQENN